MVYDCLVPQVREILYRLVSVNTRVSPASSTVDAAEGIVFVEGVHSIVPPRHFPCGIHQVPDGGNREKFFRNFDCFGIRYVVVHVPHKMHLFWGSVTNTHEVGRDTVFVGLLLLLLFGILDIASKKGFHEILVVASFFESLLTSGLLLLLLRLLPFPGLVTIFPFLRQPATPGLQDPRIPCP